MYSKIQQSYYYFMSIEIKLVPLKPLRDMRVIKGTIEELIKKENYKDTDTQDYIRAIITNENAVYDAIGQIKRIYPNTLRLDIENSKMSLNIENKSDIDNIKKRDELELFNEFFIFQNNQELNDMQIQIIKEIIEESKKEE